MPGQASGSVLPKTGRRAHLGAAHPLAQVAAQLCRSHVGPVPRVGRVACGSCWEEAIRNDERVVVECGLPREYDGDGTHFPDEVVAESAVAA